MFFSPAVGSAANRTAFVQTITNLGEKHKLNGIDFERVLCQSSVSSSWLGGSWPFRITAENTQTVKVLDVTKSQNRVLRPSFFPSRSSALVPLGEASS